MKKLSILNLLLAIALAFNTFIFHSPILGVIFGLGFVILSSYLLGQFLERRGNNVSSENSVGQENFNYSMMLFGFLTFLSITIIVLTIIYYFYQLNNYIISFYIILLSLLIIIILRNGATKDPVDLKKSNLFIIFKFKRFLHSALAHFVRSRSVGMTKRACLFIFIYLSLLLLSYLTLKTGQTVEAVRTPWFFVSKWFFLIYFLVTLNLIYLINRLKPFYSLILTSLHLFFTFSIANIIFPLGFGYDPFIHQATEKYILEHGFILPKNFYYLGQYSLVVFLTKIFQISQVVIDKNLVPFLAAILLPATIYCTFKKLTANLSASLRTGSQQLIMRDGKNPLFLYFSISLFLFLIIPFSIFTFTTPQNLADLFVIIIAFLGLNFILNNYELRTCPERSRRVTNYRLLILISLMTLTILTIHPLAGLAALIFIIIIFINKLKQKNKFTLLLYYFITLLLCISVFCVFVLFSWLSPLYKVDIVNNFNLVNFYHNLFRGSPDLFLNTNFVHLIKTLAYFLWQPVMIFIVIFFSALIGLILLKRRGYKNLSSTEAGGTKIQEYKNIETGPFITLLLYYFITFIILFINSLLIFSFLKFPFLIDYERGDFSWRIFNLSVYFLIPLAIYTITLLLYDFITQKKKMLFIFILLISANVTVSLYLSYPRQDVYATNKGFNTSIYDFNAIRHLDNITLKPYVVLANQQVGAAALTTFGFRYIDNQYFFYSIPTGGELYKIYAKMAYDGEINYEVVKKAMDLTQVDIVYFYLNDYWFNFKKIKPLLEKTAAEVMKLENDKVWVFKFAKK